MTSTFLHHAYQEKVIAHFMNMTNDLRVKPQGDFQHPWAPSLQNQTMTRLSTDVRITAHIPTVEHEKIYAIGEQSTNPSRVQVVRIACLILRHRPSRNTTKDRLIDDFFNFSARRTFIRYTRLILDNRLRYGCSNVSIVCKSSQKIEMWGKKLKKKQKNSVTQMRQKVK